MNGKRDLDWTAVQYVSGDLPEQRVAEFERRLAENQDAREAVADAVELCVAIAANRPEVTTRVVMDRSWKRKLEWMFVGGAISLAVFFVFQMITSDPQGEVVATAQTDLSDEVVSAWVESLAIAAEESLAWPEPVEFAAEEPVVDGLRSEEAPLWMVAAIAELAENEETGNDRRVDPAKTN